MKSDWRDTWVSEASTLGVLDRMEFWGTKVATSRSPQQLEFARLRYNHIIESINPTPRRLR